DDSEAKAIIENALKEKSNLVETGAFKAIAENDKKKAALIAKEFEKSANGDLLNAVGSFYKDEGNPEYNSFFIGALDKAKSFSRYNLIDTYGRYLKKQDGKELADGIAKLSEIAGHASSWFMR